MGAEPSRCADVDDEEDGELALLEVALDVGRSQSGGDIPVDAPDVITRLVLADFGEFDTAATERAGVFPCDDVTDEVPSGDLDPAHLAHDLLRRHGTGTRSKMRRSSSSAVTPSASAR